MDPFTIAFAAKSGFDIVSAYLQGQSVKKRAEMQAQLAEFNAQAMERDAQELIRVGLAKQASYLSKAQQVEGAQNVVYAAADVDASFGTAKMIKEQSRLMGQLNAKDIADAAYTQATGYKAKALEYRFGADMKLAEANRAADNFLTSTIIKTGIDIGANWSKLNFGETPQDKSLYDLMMENTDVDLNYFGTEGYSMDLSQFGMGGPTPNAGLKLGLGF